MHTEQFKDRYEMVLARVEGFQEIDERIKTFALHMKLEDGANQALAGYELTEWNRLFQRVVPSASGLDMLEQLKEVFGVKHLADAKGQLVYVLYRKPKSMASLIAGISRLAMDYKAEERNCFLVDDWWADWFPEEKSA